MKTTPYTKTALNFWNAYWVTMRPYLLFVSGVAGMVGFATGSDTGIWPSLAVFLAFFLSYGFGQALTDCFQMDTDAISSPYRPLVKGELSRTDVLLVSLAGLLACCFVFCLLDWRTLFPGFGAVIGLATYTYFKRRWWGGPFYNAWIVALLPVMGALAASGAERSLGSSPILIPVVFSVFFSYANFVLMGYFKDISADRASGYRTFVVVYGWAKTAIASDLLAVASIIATAYGLTRILSEECAPSLSWVSVPVFSAAIIMLIRAQVGIHRIRDERKAHGPISNVVRGFVLLHCAEICAVRPLWAVPAMVFYAAFELVLSARPEQSQV